MADSLWEFASAGYQRPGVAATCLDLQDKLEADVNMLLAAAWLGVDGYRWQAEEVAEIVVACSQWRTLCLLPLRKIRRDLKGVAGAENWYQRIKALELEAERQQLHRIEEVALRFLPADSATATRDDAAAIEANLLTYLATLPAAAGESRTAAALLTGLLAAAQTARP